MAAVISLMVPLLMTPTPVMLMLIGLVLQAQPFKAANLLDLLSFLALAGRLCGAIYEM